MTRPIRTVLAGLLCAVATPLALAPAAQATLVSGPPHGTDSWTGDDICGVTVDGTYVGSEPIVLTGAVTSAGFPVSIDTGTIKVRLTNPDNGRWIQFGYSGPVRISEVTDNGDGTWTKIADFSGRQRGWTSWDGNKYIDRGHAVQSYLVSQNGTPDNLDDDYVITRTQVRESGVYGMSESGFDLCEFATAELT